MRNFTLTLQPAAICQNPDRFAIISHIINPPKPFLLEESKLPIFVLIELFHIKIISLSCIQRVILFRFVPGNCLIHLDFVQLRTTMPLDLFLQHAIFRLFSSDQENS